VRAFVAIPLDDPIRDALASTVDRLATAGADVRWVTRESMHITLKFLGEVSDTGALRASFRQIRLPPVELAIAGLGHFGRRVIWAGCRGDLRPLASAIDERATALGVPREEHPFSAHVTVGRVKSARQIVALLDRLPGDHPFGKQTARAFVMYKSTLTPKGPIYEAIETFPLNP
jgi:2'-5' RNA ligase